MKQQPFTWIIVLSQLSSFTAAQQASNFDVPRDVATHYTCTDACYEDLLAKNADDVKMFGTEFDYDFYSTAANFSKSNPGDILKLEKINQAKLDLSSTSKAVSGAAYYRFQYTSIDFHGSKVPSTGFIAIPQKKPRGKKGRRTIAFAHGTTGIWRGCAPSKMPNLFDYGTWSTLVDRGYAVIATDYSGLGNNFTPHKYLVFPEHANDIFYSVVAARKAFGNVFSKEWMSMGHSQGGGAVWSLAESDLLRSKESRKAGKYIGTVAIAPATKLFDMAAFTAKLFESDKNFHDWSVTSGFVRVGHGIKSLFPSYNMSIFSETMRKRVELAEFAQLCFGANAAMVDDLGGNEILATTDLSGEKELQKFQNMTSPGLGKRSEHPILVLQGMDDTAVMPHVTIATSLDSCTYGNVMQLKLYPDEDHRTVVSKAQPLYLHFIESRFNRPTKFSKKCTTQTMPRGEKF